MSYSASGQGTFTLTVDQERALLDTARNAGAGRGPASVPELLEQAGFDVVNVHEQYPDPDVRAWQVYFNGAWGDQTKNVLHTFGKAGAGGLLDLTGEDGSQFRVVFDNGTVHELDAVVYFPGDTDPDAVCVGLTRREAQTVLALLAGDQVDSLNMVVAKLSRTLGSST